MSCTIVVSVVLILTSVIALIAANILRMESNRQLFQSLEQSTALLSNFLDVREGNVGLWLTSPLVEAMYSDPGLAKVFLPSLHTYFSKFKEQEPWIENILLLKGRKVLYSYLDIDEFLSEFNSSGDNMSNLAAMPPQGVAVMHLHRFDSQRRKPILIFKRAFSKEGISLNEANLVLILNFSKIDEKLFGKIQIGKKGFISTLAKAENGEIVLPQRLEINTEERKNYLELSQHWRSFSDLPEQHNSIVIRQQELIGRPFAIVGVASRNDIREPIINLIYFSVGFGLLSLALGIWAAIFLSGRLSAPILKLTAKAEQLAHEHLNFSPESQATTSMSLQKTSASTSNAARLGSEEGEHFFDLESKDELGSLAVSFIRMQVAIKEKINLIQTQNEQLQKNDLIKEELNQSLEQQVQRRTTQLQETLKNQQNISKKLVQKTQELDSSYRELELRSEALSESNQTLEVTLYNLQSTQQQLAQQEKMAGLGILTAGIAHEINNPTNFAHVAAQNLQVDIREFQHFVEELVEPDEAAQILQGFEQRFSKLSQHVATMLNGTERIKTIVKDLRTFTRLGDSDKRTIHISECLNSTINLVRTGWQDRVEFTSDFSEDLEIECWPTLLNQVFMNILVNACQAIAEKQKLLTSEVCGHIHIHLKRELNHLVISFEDDGIGIEAQAKAHIMEPFFTTKEVGSGTGLGLSIVYGIVEKHGGNLSFSSEPKIGSCFKLRLPLRPGN
ncbi:ATP-binding protein [Undibacterium sp.]|uniref:sensor histidine kinase n=1 Tax=Undibacterium sp. TaxID=1914977 RepID=UPI0025EDDF2A|nr:ATP-binding protein [Undibacterium sp.]